MKSFASSITQILESQNVVDAEVFSPYFVNILDGSHAKDTETATIMDLLNDLLSEQLNTDQITHICNEMLTCRDYHNIIDSKDPQDLQWEHLVFRGEDDDNDDDHIGDAGPSTNETAGTDCLDYNEQVWEQGEEGQGMMMIILVMQVPRLTRQQVLIVLITTNKFGNKEKKDKVGTKGKENLGMMMLVMKKMNIIIIMNKCSQERWK